MGEFLVITASETELLSWMCSELKLPSEEFWSFAFCLWDPERSCISQSRKEECPSWKQQVNLRREADHTDS